MIGVEKWKTKSRFPTLPPRLARPLSGRAVMGLWRSQLGFLGDRAPLGHRGLLGEAPRFRRYGLPLRAALAMAAARTASTAGAALDPVGPHRPTSKSVRTASYLSVRLQARKKPRRSLAPRPSSGLKSDLLFRVIAGLRQDFKASHSNAWRVLASHSERLSVGAGGLSFCLVRYSNRYPGNYPAEKI